MQILSYVYFYLHVLILNCIAFATLPPGIHTTVVFLSLSETSGKAANHVLFENSGVRFYNPDSKKRWEKKM